MKLNHKHSFVIMSVKDGKQVAIDELGQNTPEDNNEETFNKMREKILAQEEEPKYILFDFMYETTEGKREKIAFINW